MYRQAHRFAVDWQMFVMGHKKFPSMGAVALIPPLLKKQRLK
jgi:hypothetical protein